MNMPCQYYSCPENNCGQCFGGGCARVVENGEKED